MKEKFSFEGRWRGKRQGIKQNSVSRVYISYKATNDLARRTSVILIILSTTMILIIMYI